MWWNAGTLSLTNNNKQVIGDHAIFTSLVVGSGLIINGQVYGVENIEDNDHLTLTRPYTGATASGVSYEAFPTESRAADMLIKVSELIDLTAPLQGSVETFNSLIAIKAAEVAADKADVVAKHGEVITANNAAQSAKNDAETARATAEGYLSGAQSAKNAAEAASNLAANYRDEIQSNVSQSQIAKQAAENARDVAAGSASDAANSAVLAANYAGAIDLSNYAQLSGATFSGPINFNGGSSTGLLSAAANRTGDSGMANAAGGLGEFEVRGNGTGAAMMQFHRPNSYAAYLGIDTDNFLKVGGWSMGATSYKIYHEGMKPSKADIGLSNVDNSSDANKPVSNATQAALNTKANLSGANFSGSVGVFGSGAQSGNRVELNPDGAIEITNANGGPYIDFKNSISEDYDVRLQADVVNQTLNITGHLRTTGSTTAAGNLTSNGSLSVIGSTYLSNTAYIKAENQLALKSETGSSPTVIHRVDEANYYFLLSNPSESASVAWNDLRPFTLNVTTGQITIGNGLTVNGGIEGRAYPRKADGADINFNWSGQSGQPDWIWGGNDGTNMYVYSPSSFRVNAATTADNLNGLQGGNQGNYLRRTTDISGNGSWSRQLVLSGNEPQDDIWSSPIEIREVSQVGNTSGSSLYAPAIAFHWSNVIGGAIKMHSDGTFRFQAQDTNVSYRPIFASEHYATGWFRPTGAGGMYWDGYGRGITVSDANATYGHVSVWGNGKNGWAGYSINDWAQFMANGTECGIHSQQYGNWLVRWDNSGNAYFPANITAYSDERLKQNMRPIDNVDARREGMAKAAILYERDGETRIGFGAQTLQPSNPEVVQTADDLVGTKSVNYSDLVAVLAVDNDIQAKQIEVLEGEIVYLRSMIANIENRLSRGGF